MHTRFAIVTVVYNAEDTIYRTIESVLAQNYIQFQYVIIDGLSKDRTLYIAQEYIDSFRNTGIDYRIYSEKDGGIYDAMNKSIQYIDADYVLFLNSGDMLYDKSTLNDVASIIGYSDYDVIYGDYYLYHNDVIKRVKSRPPKDLLRGMVTAHQTVFTRTSIFDNHQYNLQYSMAADFDLYLTLFEESKRILYIDVPIVYFEVGGISQRRAIVTQSDVMRIKKHHKLLSKTEILFTPLTVFFGCLRSYILSILPESIRYRTYEHSDSLMIESNSKNV